MFDQESDPNKLSDERLEREVTTLAAHIYAATCRWLLLIAEFDRRECHLDWGFHSCTAWLAWTCGLTRRAAREHVRVARDLVDLPLTRAAFGRGELSYAKVRALTRVAVPETEAEMLDLAQNATAAQLERSVRAYRSAIAVAEGKPVDTFFAWGWEDDGTLSLRGRLSPDAGALLIEAMHHARGVACGPGGPVIPADGEPYMQPVTNADALAVMAEASLASSGSASGADRHQVLLHVGPDGRRELADGSTISPEAAKRFLCDASLAAITGGNGDGSPAASRRTRTIPAALRRALRARDVACRFPGCTHHRFLDAHHIRHWADGGPTELDNLVHLCRRHHRLIHDGSFSVAREADGGIVFRHRGGRVVRTKPPQIRGSGSAITSEPRKPPRLASGDPLDLGLTVDCMIGVSRRAARAANAEPSLVS